MKTLYLIRDGLKGTGNVGYASIGNGIQAKNTNFYLITYDFKSNHGKIEMKGKVWELYTELGQKWKQSRYHRFDTFEECVVKLKELSNCEEIRVRDSEWVYNLLKEKEQDSLFEYQLQEDLKSIIGLQIVKKKIIDLYNEVKVRKKKVEAKLPVNPPTLHLVFHGNPGTGKTMIARLIAKIYYRIGIIEKEEIKEVSRADLIGQFIGATAIKTTNVFNDALGGVLFIDEAYSLYSESDRDFGKEAIATLIKLMEDNREKIVVIIAGYSKEIQKLLSSNPGFQERFPTSIHFEDYTQEELLLICLKLIEQNHHFLFNNEAYFKLDFLIEERYKRGFFKANGRSIRYLWDEIHQNQTKRLSNQLNNTKEELTTILPEDIPQPLLT